MPTVDDPSVRQVCVGCHWTILPGLLPARSWDKIMNGLDDHFGKKLDMSEELQRYILHYLKENAAEYTESETSVKILDSIGSRTPIQLSDSKFFEKKHHEISQSDWNHKKVVYKSNCVACHIELAETGSFDEVENPNK